MVIAEYDPEFKRIFQKLDKSIKERLEKAVAKIITNPEIGKPMKFGRKGTREVYIGPFRLSYSYLVNENKIIILDLYHKDKQ